MPGVKGLRMYWPAQLFTWNPPLLVTAPGIELSLSCLGLSEANSA
jgi:hypothetical protein